MAGLIGKSKVQNGCEINYVQNKKYPNSSEKVYPNPNVSNKGLLKNPYNTINVPVPVAGERPLRITTDIYGRVFARSEVLSDPNVTNNNLLKNPYNNLSEPVPEKRIMSRQRIKEINNKSLPEFMRKNIGVSELAMKLLMMVKNKNVKLFTIKIMTYLVTKRLSDAQIALGAQGQQQILQAVNIYSQLISVTKKINTEYGYNEIQLTSQLEPQVATYEAQLILLLPFLGQASPPDIDAQITTAIADLALLSNALSRMFEQDNMIQPTTTLPAAAIIAMGGVAPAAVMPVAIPPAGGGGGGVGGGVGGAGGGGAGAGGNAGGAGGNVGGAGGGGALGGGGTGGSAGMGGSASGSGLGSNPTRVPPALPPKTSRTYGSGVSGYATPANIPAGVGGKSSATPPSLLTPVSSAGATLGGVQQPQPQQQPPADAPPLLIDPDKPAPTKASVRALAESVGVDPDKLTILSIDQVTKLDVLIRFIRDGLIKYESDGGIPKEKMARFRRTIAQIDRYRNFLFSPNPTARLGDITDWLIDEYNFFFQAQGGQGRKKRSMIQKGSGKVLYRKHQISHKVY